jgi:hypothetical protein
MSNENTLNSRIGAFSSAMEKAMSEGISQVLKDALPGVDSGTRTVAAQHVADLIFRIMNEGGLDKFKEEPLVQAPKMDLKKELKVLDG